jgi:hypothetical protein
MAQLGSYAQALGELAKESAVGSVKGLAQGMKFAAMREMPALTAGIAFAKDIRGRATKIEDVKSQEVGKRQAAATENLVRQQTTNNVISLDMARQLRQINSGISSQRMLMSQQAQAAKRTDQFAEEAERERADFNRKLLRALEKMGGGQGGSGSSPAGAGGSGGGILDSILGAIGANLGDILGGAAAGYGAYRGLKGISGRAPGGAGRGGRGGGGGGGGRRPPSRDPRTGRFRKGPGLFRRGLGALGRFGRAAALSPFTKIPGYGWAGMALGTGLMFAPDIYDFFAGPPGGDLDVTPQDRQMAQSRSWLTRFMSGGAERRARVEAANRIRRSRLQKPTPYAKKEYVLGEVTGKTTANANPGKPGSSPSQGPSTVPPPANLPSGASANINDLIIQMESGGNPKAFPSTSRAYGLGQFVPKTFNGLVAQAKPGDPLYGKTFADYKASPALQRAALAKLTEQNVAALKSNKKIVVDDVAIYLAHFLGLSGASRVLQAPDDTPISKVVGAASIEANKPVFSKVKTVGDLKAWAKRKIAQAKRELGTSSGPAAATAATAVAGDDYTKQQKLTQELGAAYARAHNDPNTSALAKENIKKSYEGAAAKLASMTPQSTASTASTTVLPQVVVTAKGINKPGIEIQGAPKPRKSTGNAAMDNFLRQQDQRALAVRAVTPASTSGTTIDSPSGPVPVSDEEAHKRLEGIEKSQGKVEKETKGLAVSSKLAARNFLRRERPTKRVLSPEEEADEFLKKAQQGFLNSFDRTLTKAFRDFGTNFLKSVGYAPGGTPVNAQEAMRVGYAGTQLGRMLDLDKKVASGLEKIIGKEYGRMLAPAVSQLGKAYLNSMAVGIGQSLFSGVGGFDAKTSNAITGQILGNLAKGNKQIAMEQLLYGLTGIATGPETIAQSYGFRSAAEGIGYMAEVFAARSTDAVRGIFGWEDRTAPQQMRDPVTGRTFTPDQAGTDQSMRNIAAGGYGGIYRRQASETLRTSQMTTLVGKSNNLLTEGAATLNGVLLVSVVNAGEFASEDEKYKQQLLGGLTGFAQGAIGGMMKNGSVSGPFGVNPGITSTPGFNPNANRYQVAQSTPDLAMNQGNRYGLVGSDVAGDISGTYELGKINYDLTKEGQRISLNAMNTSTQQNVNITSQADQNNQVAMENQTQRFESAISRIPAASGGGTSIGGSFGGDFASFLGNMAVSFVANKVTSKIKNPYLRSIANFGIQAAATRYILPSILGTGGAAAAGGAAGGVGAGAGLAGAGVLGGIAALPSAFSAAGGFAGLGTAVGRSFGLFGGAAGGATFSQYAASLLGSSGFATGANFFAGMSANSLSAAGTAFGTAGQFGYALGQAAPYAAAIMQLFQGDVKGAAITGATTYIGYAIGGPIGGFIGSIVGGLFGKGKKKAPPPKIIDKVLVVSEKNIASKVTVREANNPSDGQKQLVDAFLNVAFNTAMSIYQVSKINPPFAAIYISLRNNNLKMALPREYSGGVIEDGWVYEVSMGEKDSAQKFMLEIMRKIREVYKAESQDPEYLRKIDEGYKLVSNKTAGQLAGGLISNLKYGKYALDGREYTFGDTTNRSAQSYILGQESGRTTRGSTSAGGVTVTAQTTTTPAGSLTPTSTSGTAIQITPRGSTRGAGGSSGEQNISVVTDNSTRNVEGSTINTTYLNTNSGGDLYGRSGINTALATP